MVILLEGLASSLVNVYRQFHIEEVTGCDYRPTAS